ncbi:hypothetical protein YC2023_089550 [Brassica napus]
MRMESKKSKSMFLDLKGSSGNKGDTIRIEDYTFVGGDFKAALNILQMQPIGALLHGDIYRGPTSNNTKMRESNQHLVLKTESKETKLHFMNQHTSLTTLSETLASSASSEGRAYKYIIDFIFKWDSSHYMKKSLNKSGLQSCAVCLFVIYFFTGELFISPSSSDRRLSLNLRVHLGRSSQSIASGLLHF